MLQTITMKAMIPGYLKIGILLRHIIFHTSLSVPNSCPCQIQAYVRHIHAVTGHLSMEAAYDLEGNRRRVNTMVNTICSMWRFKIDPVKGTLLQLQKLLDVAHNTLIIWVFK